VVSADGRRRVVLERGHDDAIAPIGLRLEDVDERGVVTRTRTIGHAGIDGVADPPRTRLVVVVAPGTAGSRHGAALLLRGRYGRSTEAACEPARVLVLDVRADGVTLLRFDAEREFAGASWHASRFEAEQQIADEYGARDLPFREAPLDGRALSFLDYA
jgi:hypothetical protein